MSKNGTFIGLNYSNETVRSLLNDAGGITEGFFSVQVGDNRQEYFYSNGNAGTAVPKERYDPIFDSWRFKKSLYPLYLLECSDFCRCHEV